MARRKTNRPNQAERAMRILKYLKHHSDEDHPVLISEMSKDRRSVGNLGATETLNDMICGMARALNSGPDEALLPVEQWRLLFTNSKRLLEGDEEDDTFDDEDGKPKARVRIRNLRYRHPFTYEEIDHLIEGVLFSKTLSDGEAHRLVRKIRENLTSKYYTRRYDGISRVQAPRPMDEDRVWENIPTLQKAIEEKTKVRFRYNGYDRFGKLVPKGDTYIASPYYIAANGGHYYLIGTPDDDWDESRHGLFIWRIDLMTNLRVAEQERNGRTERLRSIPISRVEALRELWNGWDNSFFTRHLNMSYDKPVTVRLKIKVDEGWPSYTFLYDWFGDSFRRVGEDQVEVECSPYGMLHWALQYGDRVEVLAPEELREDIKKEVRKLEEKYFGKGK